MKYFMISEPASCHCHPVAEILHEFGADTDEEALVISEQWWHEMLPLHFQRYHLTRALEVPTTSKVTALLNAYG